MEKTLLIRWSFGQKLSLRIASEREICGGKMRSEKTLTMIMAGRHRSPDGKKRLRFIFSWGPARSFHFGTSDRAFEIEGRAFACRQRKNGNALGGTSSAPVIDWGGSNRSLVNELLLT